MTQPTQPAAVAAPVKAPEAAANKAAPAKAEWIKSFDLNLNTARSVFNYETESCLVSIAAKVASLFVGVLEALQNVTKAIANVAIWTANGVHSLFETEAPVAPVKPAPEKPVQAPVQVPVQVAPKKEEKLVVPDPIPRTKIVADFAKSHKAGLITAPVAGTTAALAASYLLGLGLLGSSLTGVGSAIGLGLAANSAANYIANRKPAAPVVAPAAPAAPVAGPAIRV